MSAVLAVLAAASLAGAPARADTIEVKAGPSPTGQPSQADLSTFMHLQAAAFVGTVLVPGELASCPLDYAQAMAEPGAYSVLAEQRPPQAPPAVGEGEGDLATLPAGSFSLCGWVQPEGDTGTARASAASGPVHLTVGGPTGSTEIVSPTAPQPESVVVAVSYTLALAGGEVPGLATAAIGAWAVPAPTGGCGAGTAGAVPLSSSEGRALSSSGPPVQGTVELTGRLRPGTWQLCSYLLQTFAIPPSGLPNPVPAYEFGLSAGAVTVLGPPRLSALLARPRVIRRGRGTSLLFSLDQPAAVTLRIERLAPVRGGRRGSRCLGDPATGRRLCGVALPAGQLRLNAGAGPDAVRLGPRLLGRRLLPGVYEVTALARAADGETSAPAAVVLAVLR